MKSLHFLRGGAYSFVAALLLLLTGCLGDDADNNVQPVPVGFVSIYHASPDAPGLDIIVDNRKINYNPLSYSEHVGYLNFYTGDRELKFNSPGAVNSLVDTVLKVEDGNAYSVFVINQLNSIETLVTRDSAATPAQGKAMIRFVQLSPDAPGMNVSITNTNGVTAFDNVTYKQATSFKEIDAATASFEVKSVNGGQTLLSANGISIQAGRFYTVVTRGFATPPSGNSNVLSLDIL